MITLSAAERARMAEQYGCIVPEGIEVKQIPRGVSGEPLPYWDGKQLTDGISRAESVKRHKRRVWAGMRRVDPEVAARRARVMNLHSQGLTTRQICEAVNLSECTIYHYYRDLGLKANMPKRGPSPKELEREILLRRISELAVQGKNAREIAEILGRKVKQISGFAAHYKIAMAPAPEYTKTGKLKSRSLAYALHRDGLRKKALEAIIPLYRQRKTREEIAAITGYNIGYVGEIIGASGEVGLHRRDVEDKYRLILAELDSGKSYRHVCEIIGCDKKTVWRAAKWREGQ